MKKELTSLAGFPLHLDLDRFDIESGDGICFEREVRTKLNMQAVLLDPDEVPDESELYFNYKMKSAGSYDDIFRRYNLTFACVLLPPLSLGREYNKTHGHYHPLMAGIKLAYPEVYTHYEGKLYLLMQRRIAQDPDKLEDCVLYEMQPGKSITIPAGYLHILINPSDQPALMAGLFCPDSTPEYGPVTLMGGAAYYIVNENGEETIIENSRYTIRPPLRRLTKLHGSLFNPPHPERPLWSAFVTDPEAYAMLSYPPSALSYFNSGVTR